MPSRTGESCKALGNALANHADAGATRNTAERRPLLHIEPRVLLCYLAASRDKEIRTTRARVTGARASTALPPRSRRSPKIRLPPRRSTAT